MRHLRPCTAQGHLRRRVPITRPRRAHPIPPLRSASAKVCHVHIARVRAYVRACVRACVRFAFKRASDSGVQQQLVLSSLVRCEMRSALHEPRASPRSQHRHSCPVPQCGLQVLFACCPHAHAGGRLYVRMAVVCVRQVGAVPSNYVYVLARLILRSSCRAGPGYPAIGLDTW